MTKQNPVIQQKPIFHAVGLLFMTLLNKLHIGLKFPVGLIDYIMMNGIKKQGVILAENHPNT